MFSFIEKLVIIIYSLLINYVFCFAVKRQTQPLPLQQLCRMTIRGVLHKIVELEHPELTERSDRINAKYHGLVSVKKSVNESEIEPLIQIMRKRNIIHAIRYLSDGYQYIRRLYYDDSDENIIADLFAPLHCKVLDDIKKDLTGGGSKSQQQNAADNVYDTITTSSPPRITYIEDEHQHRRNDEELFTVGVTIERGGDNGNDMFICRRFIAADLFGYRDSGYARIYVRKNTTIPTPSLDLIGELSRNVTTNDIMNKKSKIVLPTTQEHMWNYCFAGPVWQDPSYWKPLVGINAQDTTRTKKGVALEITELRMPVNMLGVPLQDVKFNPNELPLTYRTVIQKKIIALPLPRLLKQFLNYWRNFEDSYDFDLLKHYRRRIALGDGYFKID